MQVTPLRWQPDSATAAPAMALVAERSSAGNNNKPGSPSAPYAQPVLTQDTGAQRRGGGAGRRKCGTHDSGQSLVSLHLARP